MTCSGGSSRRSRPGERGPRGDGAQVAIVVGHVAWMVTFLHAHHEGEDLLVWPRLLERVPDEIDPLIYTMETQHAGLAQALDDLGAKAAGWRKTCAVPERDALAGAATDLLLRIAEHLDLEERQVLPLIDKYLSEKEWKQVGGSGLKKMSFGQLKVAFGMILSDASPEQVKIMRDTIPRAPWTLFSFTGPGPTSSTPSACTAYTFPRSQRQPDSATHDEPQRRRHRRIPGQVRLGDPGHGRRPGLPRTRPAPSSRTASRPGVHHPGGLHGP
jgi:Hemerythrin HHE cation binding domain